MTCEIKKEIISLSNKNLDKSFDSFMNATTWSIFEGELLENWKLQFSQLSIYSPYDYIWIKIPLTLDEKFCTDSLFFMNNVSKSRQRNCSIVVITFEEP